MASSRQARYLSRLGVLHEYSSCGELVSTGGLYSLVALWNSVKKLDGTMDVEWYYTRSLSGASEIGPWDEAGTLLKLLGNFAGATTILKRGLDMAENERAESEGLAAALNNLGHVLLSQVTSVV